MNGIMKTQVVKSYSTLVKTLESPKYMDGIFSKSCGRWDISYGKNNTSGFVTKSGYIDRNGVKVRISDDGKLKRASLKAILLGNSGLKKIESMLNEITGTINNPKNMNKDSQIKFYFEYKNWMYGE